MSSQPQKICPSCQQIAAVQAAVCPNCAHKFRTKFAEPTVNQAQTPPKAAAPVSIAFTHSPAVTKKFSSMLWVLGAAALVLIGGIGLAYSHSTGHNSAGYIAPSQFASSGDASGEASIPESAYAEGQARNQQPDSSPQDASQQDASMSGRHIELMGYLHKDVPIAVKDDADLITWDKTYGARVYAPEMGSEADQHLANDDLDMEQDLVGAGKIVDIDHPLAAKLLSVGGTTARIEVAEGPYAGTQGWVPKLDICDHLGAMPMFPPPPVRVVPPPPIQRPDGSFYPMAGIDFPADAQHPRGSVIRDGSKPPSGPIPLEQTIAPPQVNREMNRIQEMRDNGY